MSAVAERQVSREQLRERARELRAQGLGPTAIGRELGVAKNTVIRWVDPEYAESVRAKSLAAKRRRTGTCKNCGAITRYGGQAGRPPISEFCAECGPAVGGALARELLLGHGSVIERALAFCTEPRRFSEIRDHLGVTSNHASTLLLRNTRNGLLTRVSRGVYVATASLRPVPDRMPVAETTEATTPTRRAET